jgi:hypothetical protein
MRWWFIYNNNEMSLTALVKYCFFNFVQAYIEDVYI